MNLSDLEHSLPNGLHDAFIEKINIDYTQGTVIFQMRLLTGSPEALDKAGRERTRRAELHISGLLFFSIEPSQELLKSNVRGLWMNAGPIGVGTRTPATPIKTELLPEGAFAYWIFVDPWNAFIHLAAIDCALVWIEEEK